ncbi:MAG: hypothetical protein D3916_13315, partial [Candidatus Electrothrix sp. MAN1_4]|nr:hypothetical protein [Candidatus Electrothrix sp. MAN1_4]
MNSASHTIRQQYLHVELNGSESDGMALHRRLPDLCRDWLLQALEQALDRCAPKDEHLCIERLEIDVGAFTSEYLEKEMPEKVTQELEKALRELIPSAKSSPVNVDVGRNGGAIRKTTSRTVLEAFIFFLETGQLPWSFRLPDDYSLEQVVLESWQETEQSSSIPGAAQVRQVLASPSARKRLIQQFTPPLLKTLLARLAPATVMAEILAVLDNDKKLPAERRQTERLLWESAFSKVAAKKPVTAKAIIRDVVSTFSVEYSAAVEILARHWSLDVESRHSRPPAEVVPRREGKQGDIKAASDTESRIQSETDPSVTVQERSGKSLQPDTETSDTENESYIQGKESNTQKGLGKATLPSAHASFEHSVAGQDQSVAEEGMSPVGGPHPDTENTPVVQVRGTVAQKRSDETGREASTSPLSSGHSPAQHRT